LVFSNFSTVDGDSNINGQVEYFVDENSSEMFEIDLPHQGLMTLKKTLDFEKTKTHFVKIIAKVCKN
jgi:hypothetical protein